MPATASRGNTTRRYCRFLDTKDIDAWRALFAEDVVVTLDMAVSTGGADPQTAPPLDGFEEFFPVVWGGVEHAADRASLPHSRDRLHLRHGRDGHLGDG